MKRNRGRKRQNGSEGPPAKRIQVGFTISYQALTRAADSVSSGAKSPVSALNELGIKVTYTVLDYRGPPHCPSFTVAVTAADMTFKGHGTSKRDARANAAKVCLNALLANAGQIMPKNNDLDFTNDHVVNAPVSKFELPLKPSGQEESSVLQQSINVLPVAENGVSNEPAPLFTPAYSLPSHKSPVNIVYETFPGVVFHTTLGDGSPLDSETVPAQISHSMRFKTVCRIKDNVFEGYGSSKKQSKLAASRSALASLLGTPSEQIKPTTDCDTLPQVVADHVSKLINEKFHELMRNDPAHSKRKVLAGIVMTIGEGIERSKIIAVSTGTKCVSGEYMSVSGRAVNDCHAEVAARRCLQRYLYSQLLMYASSQNPRVPIEESDLEPLPEGGYRLKENRRLHLYISTAPCGDGRIFSPHETQTERDKHPNRFSRGQLRSKIESGEGTIPVKKSAFIQTWDGVLQGERLLTMSCSDKVARWCVTGLQGALLSQLIKPIYLNSLVLGSLLHTEHMYRAICGRIEGYIQGLPEPYRLVAPKLARAASTETRSPARAPSFSVCWCAIAQAPEVVNAVTGKLDNELPSLLCKQAMFARWIYLIKQLPPLPQGTAGDRPFVQEPEKLLYAEAKQLSTCYQLAKQCLVTAFEKAQLGTWVKKPIEQDQFLCEIHEANPRVLFAWAGREPYITTQGIVPGQNTNQIFLKQQNAISNSKQHTVEIKNEFDTVNKKRTTGDKLKVTSERVNAKVSSNSIFNDKNSEFERVKSIYDKIEVSKDLRYKPIKFVNVPDENCKSNEKQKFYILKSVHVLNRKKCRRKKFESQTGFDRYDEYKENIDIKAEAKFKDNETFGKAFTSLIEKFIGLTTRTLYNTYESLIISKIADFVSLQYTLDIIYSANEVVLNCIKTSVIENKCYIFKT